MKQFLIEDVPIHFTKNQKRLREYVKILNESYDSGIIKDDDGDFNKFDIIITYFIIIHNYLHLENSYFDIVKLCNKEINKYLNLPKLESFVDVVSKFTELYDTNNKVRFAVETLDSIEEVRLLKNPVDFYSKFYKSITNENNLIR